MDMYTKALNLDIEKIITDSDLDGVVTAAILKRWWPDAPHRAGNATPSTEEEE